MPPGSPSIAQLFEAGMLLCFGMSWPVDIVKALRTRRTEGKSLGFMALIFAGYLSGLAAKLIRAAHAEAWPEPVTALYAVNAVLVAIDIALYLLFSRSSERLPPLG